ncbi:MAG TPA: sigma-54 dependent transcriptional regulator [Polyangiales bacterium]|nr:sigma-54 dependent transcriptional regulator [Polyangiales bacterium]
MSPSEHSILVVEDEHSLRAAAARQLRQTYSQVLEADSVARALALLQTERVDAILVDIHLQDGSGFEILDALARAGAAPAVVVMTADRNIDNAITALQRHAHGFLLKPFEFPALEDALTRALEGRTPRALAPSAPTAPLHSWRAKYAPDLLGDDPSLLRVFRTIQQVCDTDCSVLITGESGTGKELVARALHTGSSRAQGPFVTVNCAAIPENLLESELFGHVRGAFTGAMAARVGSFVAADGGTLFLDEIGELPLSQQAKLLRAVQAREVVPVGDQKPRKVDVRLIAATHRDLEAMVEQGTFREDLLYRIQVVPIELPPVRNRAGDIPQLVDAFVQRVNQKRNRKVTGVTEDAMSALVTYEWPGNVRQLENVVERMVLLRAEGMIDVEDLPARMQKPRVQSAQPTELPEDGIDLRDAVEQFENKLILQALERTGWNKNRAAAVLRMNRTTLVEKLKKKNLLDESQVA